MYSPKINEKLIPFLYQIAQNRKMPMTHLTNEIIEYGLKRINEIKKTNICPMTYHLVQMTEPKTADAEILSIKN